MMFGTCFSAPFRAVKKKVHGGAPTAVYWYNEGCQSVRGSSMSNKKLCIISLLCSFVLPIGSNF